MNKIIYFILSLIFFAMFYPNGSFAKEEVSIYDRPDIYWMQVSNEYENVSKSLYKLAKINLLSNLKNNKRSAYLQQKGNFLHLPPAVILDIDDTILGSSNFSAYLQARANNKYTDAKWQDYMVKELSKEVPGSVDFIKYALKKRVAVFLVSNRSQKNYKDTINNLKKIGINYPNMKKNLMLVGGKKSWNNNKYNRYSEIAKKYRILLIVGDNITDFLPPLSSSLSYKGYKSLNKKYEKYFGKYWIQLPNPLYGSWQEVKNIKSNLSIAPLK